MKKYIIRYANGSECPEIKDKFNSYKEAGEALMDYICDHNEDLNIDDDDYLSPFDFVLEEVECKDVNEVITNFENAKKVLGLKPNDYTLFEHLPKFIAQFISDINPKHIDALVALNKLFTIAEAWNKEDSFVPDFSNEYQSKWFPWFRYNNNTAGFVYAHTDYTATYATAYIGSRLCFKTSERAEQFGKQFEDLYNKVFL